MHTKQQELSKTTTQNGGSKKLLLFNFCLVIFELTKGFYMSLWTDIRDTALDVSGWVTGAVTGYNPRAEYVNQKAQKQALQAQQRAYDEQSSEIARQKKIQQDQQRRENMQLMSSVANLTNTSYGGVSSPSIDYDKYGDLG